MATDQGRETAGLEPPVSAVCFADSSLTIGMDAGSWSVAHTEGNAWKQVLPHPVSGCGG